MKFTVSVITLFIFISYSFGQSKRDLRFTISQLVGQKDSLKFIIDKQEIELDSLHGELLSLKKTNDELKDSISSHIKNSFSESDSESDSGNDSKSIPDDFFIQKNEDKFKELTYYEDTRSSTYKREGVHGAYFHPYFYIDQDEKKSNLFRLRIQYKSDDWLFFDKVIVLINNKRFEFQGNVKRDNSSSTVVEWIDVEVSKETLEFIVDNKKRGKEVNIRFVGENYVQDFTLNNWQIKGIQNILKYYDSL